MDKKLLGIYLNDHLAAHVAGLELAKRSAASNEGTPLGAFLEGFVTQVEQERTILERLLDQVDANPNRVKTMAAWVAEKAGRLKLNGQVTGYSPLSRVLELEALAAGVFSKQAMWRAVQTVGGAAVEGTTLDELIERAERQMEDLESQRRNALAPAFSG